MSIWTLLEEEQYEEAETKVSLLLTLNRFHTLF